MATPAVRFHTKPTEEDLPLRLPGQLGPSTPTLPLGPLKLELVVPACGNLGVAGRQPWLGRRRAGARVRL